MTLCTTLTTLRRDGRNNHYDDRLQFNRAVLKPIVLVYILTIQDRRREKSIFWMEGLLATVETPPFPMKIMGM